MNPRFDPVVLSISGLDELSLEMLTDRVDRHTGSFTAHQVLDTYFGWLHQQIPKDTLTRDGYLLRRWIKSLKDRGFGQDHILSSFTSWQDWAEQQDPSSRRRYLMIREELRASILNSESATAMQRNHQSLVPYGRPETLGHTRIVGGGPKITGANDEPVRERKRKRGASPPCSMITEASEAPAGTSEEIETVTQLTNNQSDTRIRMYTPETICLDPSTPESPAASGNFSEPHTTKEDCIEETVSDSTAPISHAADLLLAYVCKRCNQKGEFMALQVCFEADLTSVGHKIQYCPTNLDPKFDKAPDPDYKCHYCKKSGEHFATLCPRNKHPSSLNGQRHLAARADSSKPRTRHKPRNNPTIDSYRPGRCSPLQDDHVEFPRKRKASSAKGAAGKSFPQSHERRVSKKAKKRHSVNSYRPEGSPRAHGESLHRSKRLDTLEFDSRTDGRLSYENDDSFMIDSSPMPAKMVGTPSGPLEGTLDRFDGLTIHNNHPADDTRPGAFKQASEEAEDFLQSLHSQFQEAEHTAAFVAEMEVISDEALKHDEKGDPTLIVDGEGQQWRVVTNPPYDKHVIGLFAGRYVPVINTPAERQTAAGMMEELDTKASSVGVQCSV